MINKNAALLHHFLQMAKTQWIGCIPPSANQHDFQRVVNPFENFAQVAVDQTLTEIEDGTDCRVCLSRQNPGFASLPLSRA